MTSVTVPACLAHVSGLRHSSRTPMRSSASVASVSIETVAWPSRTMPAPHPTPWKSATASSRNLTACSRTPSLTRSASTSLRTSSLSAFAPFHMSVTSLGTRGPSPFVAASMSASRNTGPDALAACFTTAGALSLSIVRSAATHLGRCAGCPVAISSHSPTSVLRTVTAGSTWSSSKGSRNSSRSDGSLRITSSASCFSELVFAGASVASLAPLRSSTAWSLAHVDGAAADWPLPDAPQEREARGIVAVGDPRPHERRPSLCDG